jgi:hypothetical protein
MKNVLFVPGIFLLFCSTVRATEWKITTMDSDVIEMLSSLALGSKDNPHISYSSVNADSPDITYETQQLKKPWWQLSRYDKR